MKDFDFIITKATTPEISLQTLKEAIKSDPGYKDSELMGIQIFHEVVNRIDFPNGIMCFVSVGLLKKSTELDFEKQDSAKIKNLL
jgi:hypothetical protein